MYKGISKQAAKILPIAQRVYAQKDPLAHRKDKQTARMHDITQRALAPRKLLVHRPANTGSARMQAATLRGYARKMLLVPNRSAAKMQSTIKRAYVPKRLHVTKRGAARRQSTIRRAYVPKRLHVHKLRRSPIVRMQIITRQVFVQKKRRVLRIVRIKAILDQAPAPKTRHAARGRPVPNLPINPNIAHQ